MEEVLSFKCCGLHNQNLEMHVDNTGDEPVTVKGIFELKKGDRPVDSWYLFPYWGQRIEPGTGAAFYCSMDESVFDQYDTLIIYDERGSTYEFALKDITVYSDA